MRTKVGYEMRAVGFNRDAAQFTGINVKRNLVLCMAISGALCGVAGALNITGLNPHSISVLAAFENKDEEMAEKYAREHIEDFVEKIKKVISQSNHSFSIL